MSLANAADANAALLVLGVGKLMRMWSVVVSLPSDGVSLKGEVPVECVVRVRLVT